MRGQVRNQLHALHHNPVVVDSVRQRMQALDQTVTDQITEIEAELATFLAAAGKDPPPGEDSSLDRQWVENIARLARAWRRRIVDGDGDRGDHDELHALRIGGASSSVCRTRPYATRVRHERP